MRVHRAVRCAIDAAAAGEAGDGGAGMARDGNAKVIFVLLRACSVSVE